MHVRHNTALVEQAIEHVVRRASLPIIQAEAEALATQAKAVSLRRLATGGAIGMAAIGIGLGVYLGLASPEGAPEDLAGGALPPRSPGSAPPVASSADPGKAKFTDRIKPQSQSAPAEEGIITTNFNIFNERTVSLLGEDWQISAGHYYEHENDPVWKYAWCYTTRDVDEVRVRVDLAHRSSTRAQPIAPMATSETLRRTGLTDSAALVLATKCPWHDNKLFRLSDFESAPGRVNQFRQEDPQITVGDRVLSYTGPIDQKFLGVLQQHEADFAELRLDSVGGLIAESIRAGEWLRQSGRSVSVSNECLSACVFVLAGGTGRSAPDHARIGVHRFYYPFDVDADSAIELAQQTSSDIVSYLSRMGIGIELFHAMAAVPAESIKYLDHRELRNWNLLGGKKGISELPLVVPPPFSESRLASMLIELDGYDAPGHDLPGMPIRNVTRDQCKRACLLNKSCNALTYNKAHRACFMKGTATSVVPHKDAFMAYSKELDGSLRIFRE